MGLGEVDRRTMEQVAARASRPSVVFLLGLWLLTQAASLFHPPLLDDVDSIHSEAAREMLVRHDFVTLYVDGIRYLDKPPLPYWMAATSMAIFGEHAWAVRLTLALTMLALTLYLYALGKRLYGERAGFYAGCAIATAIGPFLYTRFFIPDMIVALWMAAAFDMTLRMVAAAEREPQVPARYAIAFSLACTAAVLTKGLIGVIFPVLLLAGFLALTRRIALLGRMRPVLGTLVFFATAAPWHVLAAWQNRASGTSRGFLWFYFVNDQVDRYLNTRIPRDYDKVPLLLFYALLLLWTLPWGIFLLRAAWQRVQQWRSGNHSTRSTGMLLAWWVVLIVGFFSFSTRQEYYTLPALPALALLAGAALARRDADRRPSGAYIGMLAAGATLAVACFAGAWLSKAPPAGEQLWQTLQKHPEDYALSFGHLFDFTASAFGFFRVPLVCMGLSLLLPAAVALMLKRRGHALYANAAIALGMCAVLGTVRLGLERFYPILGSAALAQTIQETWHSGDRIVIDGEYSNNAGVNFYTRQPVSMLNGRVNNLWYGSLYADAPNRFEDNATFLSAWRGTGRVFFVTHSQRRTDTFRQQFGGTCIASFGGKFVLLNHG